MNLLKHHFRSILTTFLMISLLVIYISTGMVSSSCNGTTQHAVADTAAIMAVKCAECPGPETQNLFGAYLDTLMLAEADYDVLRNTFPSSGSQRSKIVLQFHFDKAAASKPSLIGYASLPGNKFTQGAVTSPVSRVLQKGGGQALLLPDLFVLGDQQIKFDQIDAILTTAPDEVILFIPKISPGEINVRYKVCLRGAACPDPAPETQPSPPANAN